MKVIVTKDKLAQATAKGIITQNQEESLWNLLIADANLETENVKNITGESAFVKMLYYSGTFIAIGAMGWFMNRAWDSWHGAGIAMITLLYALGFILTGRSFSSKSKILSNLFYVMAVAMTPLFTYAIQKWLGIWPGGYPGNYLDFQAYIESGWIIIEWVTLVVGAIALRYIKIPIAMAIPAFILWYMSMDITPMLFGQDYDWNNRRCVSIAFGTIMTMVAFIIDNRKSVDYGKWLYIFGGITFWGGLSTFNSGNEWTKFLYFIINVAMMCAGTLLGRSVFMLLGSLGCIGYIGHLAYSIFQDSPLFPIALAGFGLFVVFIGWFCHKNREAISEKVFAITPRAVIKMLPQNRQ